MSFDPNAQGFSRQNMAYLANCANLAYRNKRDLAGYLVDLGYDLIRNNYFFYYSDRNTDTQVFVVGDQEKIIISFRGSQAIIRDWRTNFQIFKTEFPSDDSSVGRVHKGFAEAVHPVWDGLCEEVNTLRDNNQSIWITGHSLGGALAVLAAAKFQLQNPKVEIAGVYTFGQPRVGNYDFEDYYNDTGLAEKTFRFVNNNDVVTRIPFQSFTYTHVGTMYYFDKDGRLHNEDHLSWWAKVWDRIKGRFEDIDDLDLDGIDDHKMNEYQKLAENNL